MKRNFFPERLFYMVGDDAADSLTIPEVAACYAVQNAVPELKKVAAYVARKSYTQGVREILAHLFK